MGSSEAPSPCLTSVDFCTFDLLDESFDLTEADVLRALARPGSVVRDLLLLAQEHFVELVGIVGPMSQGVHRGFRWSLAVRSHEDVVRVDHNLFDLAGVPASP